ncbi:MAG: hypothetical protein ACYDGN_18295 [Acidimicrobiales bacterium]
MALRQIGSSHKRHLFGLGHRERPALECAACYEDLRIDQLITKLPENEIETVVDVRLNASSRRPAAGRGFPSEGSQLPSRQQASAISTSGI